ncbi:MAG: aminotransferase [Thermovirgaceae bacterium]
MDIKTFAVEEWMNTHEMEAVHNIAETCVDSLTVEELLELSGEKEKILEKILATRLTYGFIPGTPRLRELLTELYGNAKPENILVTSGGISANFLALYTLVRPGDRVVCVAPTYQQLYSVPESFGADVKLLPLRPEKGFLPDPKELERLASNGLDLVVLNNPNNPTGALMDEKHLKEIVGIAKKKGAWILCDEAYRGLEHDPEDSVPSVVDLYEKAVATGSMSKVFSLAGLRLGWVSGPEEFITDCFHHRDYTTISCGRIDEVLAVTALEKRKKLLERNRKIVTESVAIVDEWVKREERVDWVKPRAGTTAFLSYDYDIPSEEFCIGLFRMNGTFLVPGKCFDREYWLRIGYAYGKETLKKGLDGLSAWLRELEKQGVGRRP